VSDDARACRDASDEGKFCRKRTKTGEGAAIFKRAPGGLQKLYGGGRRGGAGQVQQDRRLRPYRIKGRQHRGKDPPCRLHVGIALYQPGITGHRYNRVGHAALLLAQT